MGVEAAAKHPRVIRLGLKAAKPAARRKVHRGIGQAARFGASAREAGEAVLVGSALIAQALGLVERPKPRPAAPLIASGVVIGATAVYLFERGRGKHRSELPNLAAKAGAER